MSSNDFLWHWGWGINAVGLDEEGATQLVDVARKLHGVLVAYAVDPHESLALCWDRSTAEEVWKQLGRAPSDDGATDNLRTALRDWLDATSETGQLPE